MGTSSSVTVKCNDGVWRSVFCHSDGGLHWVGVELLAKFNNQEGAEFLVSDGDLSTIVKNVLSYRAWGAQPNTTREYNSMDSETFVCDEFIECEAEFNYVWNGSKWSESANPEWNKS